jgi:hypothetical protein
VWVPAAERARAEGVTVTSVIEAALLAYGTGGGVPAVPVPPSPARLETPGEIRAKVTTAREAAELGRAIAAERRQAPDRPRRPAHSPTCRCGVCRPR